jgi:hypothetical protein
MKNILFILIIFIINLEAKLIVQTYQYLGGQVLYDTETGLSWQDIPDNADEAKKVHWGWWWTKDPEKVKETWWYNFSKKQKPPIYATANEYCININIVPYYSGYWRVPNYNELNSIVDRNRTEPNPAIKKEFKFVAKDYYWTSTSYHNDPDNKAWTINFFYGDDEISTKGNAQEESKKYIRCVH